MPLSLRLLAHWCHERGIQIIAYGALGGARMQRDDYPPALRALAAMAGGAAPEHVLLRWAVEQRASVIFGSRSPLHIQQNLNAVRNLSLSLEERKVLERAKQPATFKQWGNLQKPQMANGRDCWSEWLSLHQEQWAALRHKSQRGRPWRSFNASGFVPRDPSSCSLPDELLSAAARALSEHMAFQRMPFVVVPPQLISAFGADRLIFESRLSEGLRGLRGLDENLCATPSDGGDRRVADCSRSTVLCAQFHETPLLSEIVLQFLLRAEGAQRQNRQSAKRGGKASTLCDVSRLYCARGGVQDKATVGGFAPSGASPGTGWHVDSLLGSRPKALAYLTDVLSPSDAAFSMAVDYNHRRATNSALRCTRSGTTACRWPACGHQIRKGERFDDAKIEGIVLGNRSYAHVDEATRRAPTEPFAVSIYGSMGTTVVFDGRNLHRARKSVAATTRITITNYYSWSGDPPPVESTANGTAIAEATAATEACLQSRLSEGSSRSQLRAKSLSAATTSCLRFVSGCGPSEEAVVGKRPHMGCRISPGWNMPPYGTDHRQNIHPL